MKILVDGRALTHKHFTGVENYAMTIYQELLKTLDVTLLKPKSQNKILQHLWEHIVLPYRAREYDLLFSPANIAPIWKPKKVKLVVTLHDSAFITYPKSVSKFFYYYYKYTIPRVLKIADRVITISEFSKTEIIKNYPFVKDKIKVVYNGIDTEKFYQSKNQDKEKYLLFVGSLNPRKNIINLIKAFEKIVSKEEIKLKIVGKFSDIYSLSKDEQEVLQIAKKNNRIIFLENVEDKQLVKLYQNALVFVFPSIYEGFGLPPLEAMACGTPVIASNIASLVEVCGDSALYIEPFNIDDIANKIDLLLEDINLQNQLIKNGFKRVEKFTWEKSAKEHLKVFEKVFQN